MQPLSITSAAGLRRRASPGGGFSRAGDARVSIWSKALLALAGTLLFFQGRVVSLTAYVLFGLYLGFRYATRHAVGTLRASRFGKRVRLFPGERADVVLEIASDSPFPLPWILVEETVDQNLRAREYGAYLFGISLGSRGRCVLTYPIEARSRGVYSIGPVHLTTGDPLGFAETRVELAGLTEVLVYPRIHPLDALGPGVVAVAGTTKSYKRRIEDISRPVGVRDYVAGESIRHVHWKATAHAQSLKVKTFEATGHDDWVVVLDLVPEHYRSWNVTSMSELAIEVAASLLADAARKRQAFGLYMLGRVQGTKRSSFWSSGVRKGHAHLATCLEMLARAELGGESAGVVTVLEQAAARVAATTTIFVVTPRVDARIAASLLRVAKTGRRAVVVEVTDDPESGSLPAGVGYARVSYRGDIARTFTGRHPIGAIHR